MEDREQADRERRRVPRPDAGASGAPGWSPPVGDRPPVGEPLVAPRRRPAANGTDRRRAAGAPGPDAEVPAGPGEPDGPTAAALPEPVAPPAPFAGRTVLVTGAASEFGSAAAAAFATAGAEVHLLDADHGALDRVAAGLPSGTRSLLLSCDLGSVEDIRSVGAFLEQAEASPDVVVHAPHVAAPGTLLASPVEDLDEHYLIGVRGPAVLLQELAPLLAPGATVVFAGPPLPDGPTDAHRAVADAARRELVAALRTELDDRGVTVMSACARSGTPTDHLVAALLDALAADRPADLLDVTLAPRPVGGAGDATNGDEGDGTPAATGEGADRAPEA